jgi:hypothetical protein
MITAFSIYNFGVRNESQGWKECTPYCSTKNFQYSLHFIMPSCMLFRGALGGALQWLRIKMAD